MAIIIVAAIIGFIIGLLDYDEIAGGFLGGFIGCLTGLVLYLVAGAFIGCFLPTKEVMVAEYEICALKDSSEIEGRHYLFSGYIEEQLVFRYVIKTDKGKHIEEIKGTTNVYINEGDYTPMVQVYSQEFVYDWFNWFAYSIYDTEYVFYVPENTITNEYEIDLN